MSETREIYQSAIGNPSIREGIDPTILERVYNFICGYKIVYDGTSPGYREIVDGVIGIQSVREVRDYLEQLAADHKIIIDDDGKHRFIRVVGARWVAPPR